MRFSRPRILEWVAISSSRGSSQPRDRTWVSCTAGRYFTIWASKEALILGEITGKRRRGWQRMRWLDSIINSMDMNLGKLWEMVRDKEAWHAAFHRVTKSQTQQWLTNNYRNTELNYKKHFHPHSMTLVVFSHSVVYNSWKKNSIGKTAVLG